MSFLIDDRGSLPPAEDWPLLLEDYRRSWDYYKINLNERARIYDLFLKTIAFPSGLISISLAILPKFFLDYAENSKSVLAESGQFYDGYVLLTGILVFVFSLVGTVMYILHFYEEEVSKDYLKFMKDVRLRISSDYPEMKHFLKPEPDPNKRRRIFGLKASFFKTFSMCLVNSLLSALGLFMIFEGVFGWLSRHPLWQNLFIGVGLYVGFIILNLFIRGVLFRSKKQPHCAQSQNAAQ
ncbi:MAG: hypothetical protein AAGC95_05485 [Pseudomonadota bacterium]